MGDQTRRCAVCGREQPPNERWELFEDNLYGERQPICGDDCLMRWAGEESGVPAEASL